MNFFQACNNIMLIEHSKYKKRTLDAVIFYNDLNVQALLIDSPIQHQIRNDKIFEYYTYICIWSRVFSTAQPLFKLIQNNPHPSMPLECRISHPVNASNTLISYEKLGYLQMIRYKYHKHLAIYATKGIVTYKYWTYPYQKMANRIQHKCNSIVHVQ